MTIRHQGCSGPMQRVALAPGNFPATSPIGGKMYEAPSLERYGTFRELTKGGGADVSDLFTSNSSDNCDLVGTDPVTGDPIVQCTIFSI